MSLSFTALKFNLKLPSAALWGTVVPKLHLQCPVKETEELLFSQTHMPRPLFCVGVHCVLLSFRPWILLKTISFSHPFALISVLPSTQLVPEVLSSISRWLEFPFLLYNVLLTLVGLGMLFTA